MSGIEVRSRWRAIFLLILALLSGCATANAPRGWLPTAVEAQKRAFGGWIFVWTGPKGKLSLAAQGELIAVGTDRVYVLASDGMKETLTAEITEARMAFYNSQSSNLAAWSVVGLLSTLSHGALLVISAPVWAVGGSAATLSHDSTSRTRFPKKQWEELSKYARFPQGLPPGLELASLKPAPPAKPPKSTAKP